jgi:O-acetyl-ADP-ribose deacetylase
MSEKLAVGTAVLELVRGDITRQDTQAIVNAANTGLRGGGGVDGAIHRAGGPSIMAECRRIGHCPTGGAVVTGGGDLAAEYVIHTVGPVYKGGGRGEAEKLSSCYRESLRLARERGIASIAFPSISTGVYGYPVEAAARVALKEIVGHLREHETPALVRMVLFDSSALRIYAEALDEHHAEG